MKLTIQRLKQLIKEELRKKINETLTKDEQEYHVAAIDIIQKELKNGMPEEQLKDIIKEYYPESEYHYDAIVCHLLKNGLIKKEEIVGLDKLRVCPEAE